MQISRCAKMVIATVYFLELPLTMFWKQELLAVQGLALTAQQLARQSKWLERSSCPRPAQSDRQGEQPVRNGLPDRRSHPGFLWGVPLTVLPRFVQVMMHWQCWRNKGF